MGSYCSRMDLEPLPVPPDQSNGEAIVHRAPPVAGRGCGKAVSCGFKGTALQHLKLWTRQVEFCKGLTLSNAISWHVQPASAYRIDLYSTVRYLSTHASLLEKSLPCIDDGRPTETANCACLSASVSAGSPRCALLQTGSLHHPRPPPSSFPPCPCK